MVLKSVCIWNIMFTLSLCSMKQKYGILRLSTKGS